MKAAVLLVDDDRALCETLAVGLERRGYEIVWTTSPEEALTIVGSRDLDVVVTDLHMKKITGVELCSRIVGVRRDVPVIMLTAFGNLESAVAAIRAGAYDFIDKPVQLDVLDIAISRAAKHRALTDEVKRLRVEVGKGPRFAELLGESPAMLAVHELIDRVAASEASVLVTGESGTGKEIVARALHSRSRRAAGPFIAVNCAAMPEALLESELFGHAKGAFTDARAAHVGLFAAAKGGTIFLDEIGDMPLALQPKLLRVLQERSARPVGATSELPIDARFLAATNRDLDTAVEEGRFREDLYFRVNVIQVPLPPLRARGGDVLLLAQHFTRHFAARNAKGVTGLSPAAAEALVAYAWPGNVRELQNCIERAVALARHDEIGVADLPDKIRSYKSSHVVLAASDPSELVPMEQVERRYIARVLEAVAGNKTAAARILGIERKTLYRKLDAMGLAPKRD